MPTSPYYSVQGYKDGADTYENYGIDAVISVNCDYTNIIVAQKAAFRNLICKAVAKGMLREIIYNPNARNNRNESNVDEKQLLYEADGDARAYSWNSSGLGNAYRKALKGLTFDRSKIDRFCLPCRRRGLKYTTTG